MTAASVLEAVLLDKEFEALLTASEAAAKRAHMLEQQIQATGANQGHGWGSSAEALRREAVEARREADRIQAQVVAAAGLIGSGAVVCPPELREEAPRRRRVPSLRLAFAGGRR